MATRFSWHSKFTLILLSGFLTALGLIFLSFFILQFANPVTRRLLLSLVATLALLNGFLIYYVIFRVYRPLQVLIQETEETLKGLRQGEVSLIGDDEIGKLANNFNQIILDAQMKRMELEASSNEAASHAQIIEQTYRELDKKIYDLFTLFNIGKELNSTLSMDAILKIACFTCMGQTGITTMTIMLLENHESNKLVTVYERGNRDKERPNSLELGDDFHSVLHMTEQPLIVSDLEFTPGQEKEKKFLSALKTAMITPLTAKKNVIGVLLMGKKLSGEEFSQSEKDFVSTLASLAAIALENARLYELAITDAMTRLYLKRYFQLRLDDEIKRAERYHSKIALLMLDIDHFKRVNDTYGHTKGDDILISVANSIRENFRDVDITARYGGEEFCVLMPENSKEDAMIAAERLRKNIEKKVHDLGGKNVSVTISIGISEFPCDGKTQLSLIESADAALYRSKENGRNQTTLA